MNVFTNNSFPRRVLRTWTDFKQPVPRRVYVIHGLALAAAKYAGDVLLVYAATGTLWWPTRYVPALAALFTLSPPADAWWLAPAMALWTLPFLALGATLTMRRAVDANLSPTLAVLFLVPYVNYVLMAALSVRGSHAAAPVTQPASADVPARQTGIFAVTAGVITAVGAVALGAELMRTTPYGGWLFLLTPFLMGATTAFVYTHRGGPNPPGPSGVVVLAVLVTGTIFLAFGVEGAMCLVMALPLAIPVALVGSLVGRHAAASARDRSPALFMLLVLPLAGAVEPPSGRQVHEVRSSVVIDASPDVVWSEVIAFPEIPAPEEWFFRAGIAYPVRAQIDGSGVGAVRYCVFSTGAFVEPITRWEPGHRLSFDVTVNPAPMRELSPYRDLAPRHLHGYLRAQRGEFRLIPLSDGRTRLEGSTWYEIEMAPEGYWQVFSDALIHRIHQRVLDHIKHTAERQRDSAGGV